jgi:hypothetical protein
MAGIVREALAVDRAFGRGCLRGRLPAVCPGELHISIRNPRIMSILCGSLVFRLRASRDDPGP